MTRVEHLSPDVTLYLGDCRDILPTLGKVDAVVTDPPYGILNVASGKTSAIRKSRRAVGSGKLKDRLINTADYSWDSDSPSRETIKLLREISNSQILWGGNYFDLPPTRCVLVWDKMQPWENFSQVEIAWTSLEKPASIYRHDKSNIGNKEHPTQKPLNLMRWSIGHLPKSCDLILDPYMGSGTTGVACVQLERKFIGIEIEPKYFDIACRRISNELKQPRLPFVEPKKQNTKPNLLFPEPANKATGAEL